MKKSRVALLALPLLLLTSCAGSPVEGTSYGPDADDPPIAVVASINVYGSLVEQIGGDHVAVTSIIRSVSQDPHAYTATPRDQLSVREADLVIMNGGGYDPFMIRLLEESSAQTVTAVEFSPTYQAAIRDEEDHSESHADDHAEEHGHGEEHDHAEEHDHGEHHAQGINEHVWFDPETITHVVEKIADELSALDPENAADFREQADRLTSDVATQQTRLHNLEEVAAGQGVFITEPLPRDVARAAGLVDLTPVGFAEATEQRRDVPPSILLESLTVIGSGQVVALLTNVQTAGPETQRVEAEAKAHNIPVIEFSELLQDGQSYVDWLRSGVDGLESAFVLN